MSRVRTTQPSRQKGPHDIGTLWTLMRSGSTARCALLSGSDGLEVRVLMDGAVLRSQRCGRYAEAFERAERWGVLMRDRGWARLR